MAKKDKKSDVKITRITAGNNDRTSTKLTTKKSSTTKQSTKEPLKEGKKNSNKDKDKAKAKSPRKMGPLAAIGRYFSGAWYELSQVRWPDRKSTWGMTGALLLFTAFFVLIILLLDAGFKYLFDIIY